jgi:threonine dehydrogenase-like Zn-dependent dehydrogenase
LKNHILVIYGLPLLRLATIGHSEEHRIVEALLNSQKIKFTKKIMKALTYIAKSRFEVTEKAKPVIQAPTDAVVRVTLSSICTSDLHIKHGSVPRAVPGVTVGHEMVGVVESVGDAITKVKPGDRVAVNVETFCGECFFCRHGWVNNCTDPNGGWALGCRIDVGQTEFVRVPFADNGLTKIPNNDGCNCDEILRLISEGKIDTTPLITHTFPFSQIEEAYDLFENRRDNVIKVAIKNDNIDNNGEEV